MKIALCLRGLTNLFLKSYDNLKTNIIDDLKKNNDVDIFLNTYKTDLHDQLVEKLSPVDILYNPNRDHLGMPVYYIVPLQIVECCEMVKNYEIKHNATYDVVIITRFDLIFNTPLSTHRLDYEKINVECLLLPDNSGDNFILFHRKFIDAVIASVKTCMNEKNHAHKLWIYFQNNNLGMHYICGHTWKINPNFDVMFRFAKYVFPN